METVLSWNIFLLNWKIFKTFDLLSAINTLLNKINEFPRPIITVPTFNKTAPSAKFVFKLFFAAN